MTRSDLDDAFAHHVWASLQIIDACSALGPAQLAGQVPGTYGSILDTLRHLVEADAWYLFVLTGDRAELFDERHMDMTALRRVMQDHGATWSSVLTAGLDPDVDVLALHDDGSAGHAPRGIRLAQALHHGTDHRSQVCTSLSALGLEPPSIDVWDFGALDGRVFDDPTPA